MEDKDSVLKKLLLATVGAAAITVEKAKELTEYLIKKGELTVEEGKVLNVELEHKLKEKFCKPCCGEIDVSKLTPEQRAALLKQLQEQDD